MKNKPYICAFSGLIIILIGIFVLIGLPIVIMRIIYWQLRLEPESQAYALWKDIPLPIYQKFYFFNVTNALDIERRGAKPKLVQVGPFTYESKWHKQNIEYHPNGTVSYREIKTYHFVRELSVADDNMTVMTLNGPLAVTLTLLQRAPSAVRLVVTLALDAASEGFFIKRSIKQLLYEGYPDLLTTFGPLLNSKIPSNNHGRFGWLLGKNGSAEDRYTVFTGRDDINKINEINLVNGKESLSYWPDDECNSLNGSTNGELFPPRNKNNEQESLYLFYPDFCRKWKLNFNGTRMLDGISARRYVPDEHTFSNQIDYPPNACFISKLPTPQPQSILFMSNNRAVSSARQRNGRFPSGIFDMSACKYGAPVFMSFPHFLHADPQFTEKVDGLQANASKHEFFMSLEPMTGSSVEFAGRVQINIYINKPPGLFRYRHVPDIVFPVFWQELGIGMTDAFANHLKWVIKQPELISSISSTLILVIGTLLTVTSLLFPLYNHYHYQTKNRESQNEAGSDSQSDKTENSQVDNDTHDIIVQNQNSFNANNGIYNPALAT